MGYQLVPPPCILWHFHQGWGLEREKLTWNSAGDRQLAMYSLPAMQQPHWQCHGLTLRGPSERGPQTPSPLSHILSQHGWTAAQIGHPLSPWLSLRLLLTGAVPLLPGVPHTPLSWVWHVTWLVEYERKQCVHLSPASSQWLGSPGTVTGWSSAHGVTAVLSL